MEARIKHFFARCNARQRRYVIVIVVASLLLGCPDTQRGRANATVNITVPHELSRALAVPNSTLSIAVYRAEDRTSLGETAATWVDGAANIDEFRITDLPLGEYSIFLRYYLESSVHPFAKTLVGETSPIAVVMAESTANHFDFSAATLQPAPDDDNDGYSNLAELRAGSEPQNFDSTPKYGDKELTFDISGLSSEPLEVENSKHNSVVRFTQDGSTTGRVTLDAKANFSLLVLKQPNSRHCRIINPDGNKDSDSVIRIQCAALIELTVQVSQYQNSDTKLVLLSHMDETLTIATEGTFSFLTRIRPGNYSVAVRTQPSNPAQDCSVDKGNGNIDSGPIPTVLVTCKIVDASEITVSGTAQGLKGPLRLSINDSSTNSPLEIIDVNLDGPFSKSIAANSSNVSLRINTPPSGQRCDLGTKQVTPGTHTGYAVECASIVVQTPSAGKHLHLKWTPVAGAANYTIHYCVNESCSSIGPLTGNPEHQTTEPIPEGLYHVRVTANFDSNAQVSSDWTLIGVGPWSANNGVSGLATTPDGALYVGGSFTQLYPYTGAALLVPQTGHSKRSNSGFPRLRGNVVAAIADDAGGWYVGGRFVVLGEDAKASNLVHINADGTLDGNFFPNPNRTVKSLYRHGSVLYAGGDFTQIGSENAAILAALDNRGAVLQSWNRGLAPTCSPMPTDGDSCGVNALMVYADVLYFGGSFTQVNGTTARTNLAAVAALSGQLVDAWAPSANARVRALAQAGERIYVGGSFSAISEHPRQALAAINLDGSINDWIGNMVGPADSGSRVAALATSKGVLYVGGGFNEVKTLDIESSQRRRFAAFDLATGKLKSWIVNVGGTSCCSSFDDVQSLFSANGIVYIGGEFKEVNGVSRVRIAAIDYESKTLLPWTLEPNSAPKTLVGDVATEGPAENRLFVGGGFEGLGAHERMFFAEILPDGNISSWTLRPNWLISALAVHNTTLYAVGSFKSIAIGPVPYQRGGGAAFDLQSKTVLDWNPQLAKKDGDIFPIDLAVDANAVYIAGRFDSASGQERIGMVATDPLSGALLANQLDVRVINGDSIPVRAVELYNNGPLYVGGKFSGIGSGSSSYLARIDTGTRTPLDGSSPITGVVRSIVLTSDRAFLGADVDQSVPEGFRKGSNGDAIGFFAVLNTANDTLIPVTDLPNSSVIALAVREDRIYMGGNFSTIGTAARWRLGALDIRSGSVTGWDPQLETNFNSRDSINVLAINNGTVYAGGSFVTKDGRSARLGEFSP